jgi:uncharacterized membrane protein
LRGRRRLLLALACGIVVGLVLPQSLRGITRGLIGWNVAVWLYLLLVWRAMAELDHERLRRLAAAQADSASVVLAIAIGATLVAIAAIFAELGGVKNGTSGHAWPQLLLVLSTLISSWLLLPSEFALAYAGRYFGGERPRGMEFPGMAQHKGTEALPDYSDFLYFALTIAATAQTSDVGVTTRSMRQLVIVHAVLSFAFNTTVLALAINLAASLF